MVGSTPTLGCPINAAASGEEAGPSDGGGSSASGDDPGVPNLAELAEKLLEEEESSALNLVKVNAKYVEKVTGENPEAIKADIVGKRGSQYDLYVDKNTGDLYVLRKGGGGEPQPTGLRLPR